MLPLKHDISGHLNKIERSARALIERAAAGLAVEHSIAKVGGTS